MNLVLLGAPGSGKGTQAKMLSDYYKIEKISLGDILREEAKKETSLGKSLGEYMREGVLVPDAIIKEVVEKRIDRAGFVIDGFPRNLNQALIFKDILEEKNISLDKVIYLKVTEDIAVTRLSGRRICQNCGALYHIVTMPPKIEGICDKCGDKLIIREDDKEETVRKRWEVFMEETASVIDYYSKKNCLLEIDGTYDKEKVFEEIKRKISL